MRAGTALVTAIFGLAFCLATLNAVSAADAPAPVAPAAAQAAGDDESADDDAKPKTIDEKMQARFPQPIRVGSLIGQPLLDGGHATIGYVEQVVRTEDGKIQLIVPYRSWLGWAKFLDHYDTKLVAVPIETVGSMGLALSAIDMGRESFDAAPAWTMGTGRDIPVTDEISIALARE